MKHEIAGTAYNTEIWECWV